MKLEDFLSVGRAAKQLGIHVDTLRKGSFKEYFKIYLHPNGSWRMYKKDDIEQFLREKELEERK